MFWGVGGFRLTRLVSFLARLFFLAGAGEIDEMRKGKVRVPRVCVTVVEIMVVVLWFLSKKI